MNYCRLQKVENHTFVVSLSVSIDLFVFAQLVIHPIKSSIDQLCQQYFFRLRLQAVHHLRPAHVVSRFQFLGHICLICLICHLLHHLFQPTICCFTDLLQLDCQGSVQHYCLEDRRLMLSRTVFAHPTIFVQWPHALLRQIDNGRFWYTIFDKQQVLRRLLFLEQFHQSFADCLIKPLFSPSLSCSIDSVISSLYNCTIRLLCGRIYKQAEVVIIEDYLLWSQGNS